MPLIKQCSFHKKFQCEALLSDLSSREIFTCMKCIQQNKINTRALITIQDILDSDEQSVLDNWPPLDNQAEILSKVSAILSENEPKYPTKEICMKINKYFEELEKSLIETIHQQKESMLYLAQVYCDTSATVRETYQSIASLDQFKKILNSTNSNNNLSHCTNNNHNNSNSNNNNTLEQHLQEECDQSQLYQFIQQKYSEQQYNTQKIQLAIKQHEEQSCLFDFEKPEEIKSRIIESLKSINFFMLDNDEDIQDYQSQITPTSQSSLSFEEKMEEYHPQIDLLMKLIGNKSNFCTDDFLKELKYKLYKLKTYFSRISISNAFIDDKRPVNFESFSNSQMNDFIAIAQLISANNNIIEQGQEKSQQSNGQNLITSTKSTPSSTSLVSNLQKLLRMSQINELLKTQDERNMKLSFTKTIFKDSHHASTVELDNTNNTAVFQSIIQGYSSAYLNVPIMNELIYIMRMKIESKNNHFHFFCGIVPTQIKDIQFMHQQPVIFTQKDDRIRAEKIKGQPLHTVRQRNKEIEIRFCISQKKFICCDYPSYDNIQIIPKSNFSDINLNESFVFAFELYYPGDKFIVSDLQIVDSFPEIK